MSESLQFEEHAGRRTPVMEKRDVGPFDSISFSGIGNLCITQSAQPGLVLEASRDTLPNIDTYVENGMLRIRPYNVWRLGRINVYANMPEISKINASGAVKVFSRSTLEAEELAIRGSGSTSFELEVNTKDLKIHLSGSASISLEGAAAIFMVKASGAVKIRAFELFTDQADITASGAVRADINVSQNLICKMSGASKTNLKGGANLSKIKTSGAAKINRVE